MTVGGNHIDAEQSESACGDSKKIETESEKLQYILYSLRLTQVSFAQHLGISQAYVSALLRGDRQLSKKLTKKCSLFCRSIRIGGIATPVIRFFMMCLTYLQ